MKARAYSKGTALPIVLLLTAIMLVTAGAWLQTSLVASRAAVAARERIQAFHAADSALIRCSGMLQLAAPPTSDEPRQWRNKTSFEGPNASAVTPFVTWPYAARVPQCLIEAWTHAAGQAGVSYLLTARGFGATTSSEAWLQARIDVVDGVASSHWRRVVARPF